MVDCDLYSLSLDADPPEFRGRVSGDTGTAGCCGAKSCAAGVVMTEVFLIFSNESPYFFYKAQGGGDWYEAAIVMYAAPNNAEGDTISLSDLSSYTIVAAKIVRGSTLNDFIQDGFSGSFSGNHFFAFFLASYDFSAGRILGASMEIDAFGALPAGG